MFSYKRDIEFLKIEFDEYKNLKFVDSKTLNTLDNAIFFKKHVDLTIYDLEKNLEKDSEKDSEKDLEKDSEKDLEEKPLILTKDQYNADIKIKNWLKDKNSKFFLIKGYAGTGKSTLLNTIKNYNYKFVFTAPTNKAKKVLIDMLDKDAYTIYSYLGIRMTPNEEDLFLSYPDVIPYVSSNTVIVVDECYCIEKNLLEFIEEVAKNNDNIKFLFVGDPLQLNPVNEEKSYVPRIVSKQNQILLKEVVRFDDELLKLSKKIRKNMKERNFNSPISDDRNKNDLEKGVFVKSKSKFLNDLKKLDNPRDFNHIKVVAWRNKQVNEYNRIIRNNFGFKDEFEKGDIVMLKDVVMDENMSNIIANVDDEGRIVNLQKSSKKVFERNISIWRITLNLPEYFLNLNIPREKGNTKLIILLNELADDAKRENNKNKRKKKWQDFWKVKQTFNSLRYSYALTSHRIQGSTVTGVFLDQEDILKNRNKMEAFRALMVGCTRPTKFLETF